jgi:hypothetical protein
MAKKRRRRTTVFEQIGPDGPAGMPALPVQGEGQAAVLRMLARLLHQVADELLAMADRARRE